MDVDGAVGDEAVTDEGIVALRGLDELLAREHPAGPTGEEVQDAELGCCKLDDARPRRHVVFAGVDGERADAQHCLAIGLLVAAQHGSEARREDARAERLGDVVGGAELETRDDVGLAALGGEHDDGDVPGRGLR